MVTWTVALETCDHSFEFKLMDGHVSLLFCIMFPYVDTKHTGWSKMIGHVSVFFCIMFPYVDTTRTGWSKMMEQVSRLNNFTEKKDTKMEFSVKNSTTHSFHIDIRWAQRSDRSYPVFTSAFTRCRAMIVKAFLEWLALHSLEISPADHTNLGLSLTKRN